MLQELITDVNEASDETGIQVYIGNETPVQTMKDCSVVTANYDLGEGIREPLVSSVLSGWTTRRCSAL